MQIQYSSWTNRWLLKLHVNFLVWRRSEASGCQVDWNCNFCYRHFVATRRPNASSHRVGSKRLLIDHLVAYLMRCSSIKFSLNRTAYSSWKSPSSNELGSPRSPTSDKERGTNDSPDLIGLKRCLIEHFTGYRLMSDFIKFAEKWTSNLRLKWTQFCRFQTLNEIVSKINNSRTLHQIKTVSKDFK